MWTLILDRSHACLLEEDRLPWVPLTPRRRPLRAVDERWLGAGIVLPPPAGSRPRADGEGRDFAFVLRGVPAPPGMAWRPLREAAAQSEELWRLYVELMLGGWEPPVRELDVWSFGNEPEMAARLVHLVACGEKRITMGWPEAALRDRTPLAVAGGLSIVTDGYGYPRIVLRSTEVREIPFGLIDAATAAGEGEGDLTHGDWREGHERYFGAEALKIGLPFNEETIISVERFEVLHVVGRAR